MLVEQWGSCRGGAGYRVAELPVHVHVHGVHV